MPENPVPEPFKMIQYIKIIILILICPALYACSMRSMVITEVATMAEQGMAAFETDDDLALMEKAFPANIKLMETFLANHPDNYRMLGLLAKLYGSYGYVFVEPRLEAMKMNVDYPGTVVDAYGDSGVMKLKETLNRYYLKGADYALGALEARHENCRDQLKNVADADAFIASLTEKDVHALFWYAFNVGGYVNLNLDSVRAVSMAHLTEKSMKRVIEIDPGYFHGFAHLFLLAYYGSRPPMMGGSPAKALMHYKQLKKISGDGFLLADVYYARYILYQQQERDTFEKALTRVIETAYSGKKYAMLNQAAKIRAIVYLEAIDDLF